MPKISALPAASELQSADLFAIDQNATTKKITTSLVTSYMSAHVTITDANFSGVLGLNHGGTNKLITADNGAIVYCDSNSFELLASTPTAGKVLQSGASGAPSWSTPTYPSTSGIAGKILASDGTNIVYSTSLFPTTVGAAGTFIRSNGTDWVASTATLANTYTINNLLYASAADTVVGLATANNGVLVTSAGGVPSIAATLPNAVQDNITRLGTIVSGIWHGTAIAEIYGGTNQTSYTLGDTLYASASNTLSKLAGNTTATKQFLSQTGTGVVSAAPAWSTVSASDIVSGEALTKVDDTNVTLTLGGTPATALLKASSITAGWSGQLSLARGGTNKNITASLGAVVYCDADSFELSAVGSAGQVFQSNGAGIPTWSTPTYPSASGSAGKILRADGTNNVYSTSTFADTYAINTILYAGSANTVSGLAPSNSSILASTSAGVPTWVGALTNGQILIGSTGATPVAATLSAGAGISIANGAGTITISGTGSGIGWTEIVASPQAMTADSGYIANTAGLLTFTLPVTAAIGTAINVIGKGAGGWIIAQNAGQNIQVGNLSSTVGAGGSVASTNRYDSISLICTTADTTWTVLGAPQSAGLTIV